MKANLKSRLSSIHIKPGPAFLMVMASAALLLAACNLSIAQPTVDPNSVATIVYQTAQARLTQAAFETLVAQLTQVSQPTSTESSKPTIAPSATTTPLAPATSTSTLVPATPTSTLVPATPTSTLAPTKVPTNTPIPPTFTSTPKPSPVDWVKFEKDVTVPDGAKFNPAATFTKTWRLKNIGSTTWNTHYALVFVSGESMGAQKVINLTSQVHPGDTVDLSVAMVAPTNVGVYQGFWMLRNSAGTLFGIGPDGDKPFWVKIEVVKTENVAYNFVTNYCASGVSWRNSIPGSGNSLPCPGTPGSPDGSVLRVDNPPLENGVIDNEPALRVEPQRVDKGIITGTYPAFTVQNGDHFKTVIGCWDGATNCDIIFSLHFRIGNGPEQSLGSWEEKFDHQIRKIDVDLSSLAGQNVTFILKVAAKGAANPQNIGHWLLPRIVRK
jgi:hypothetical protein